MPESGICQYSTDVLRVRTVHCQTGLSCNDAGMLAHLFLKAFEGAIWLALIGLLVGLARSPP